MAGKVPIESRLLGQQKKAAGGGASSPASSKKGVGAKSGFTSEKVANLPRSFDLNSALDKAYSKVVNYMNGMLEVRDLEVRMDKNGGSSIGHVLDKETGETVSSYEGKEMLRLYSHNNQARGVVVDGKI